MSSSSRGTQTPRKTTRLRTNKASLPEIVNAKIILDIENCNGTNSIDYKFVWHEDLYQGCDRNTVRYRFRYTVQLKLNSSKTEWKKLVKWANNFMADNNKPYESSDDTLEDMSTSYTRAQAAAKKASKDAERKKKKKKNKNGKRVMHDFNQRKLLNLIIAFFLDR